MNCRVEGCDRPVHVLIHQLCGTHYKHYNLGKELKPLKPYRRAARIEEAGRTCTHCGRFQPWTEFPVKEGGTGHGSWCNPCMCEATRR